VNYQNLRLRIITLFVLTLGGVLVLVPTFSSNLPQFWQDYLPTRRINLGLDLQGGTHIVLSVGVDKAIETALDRNAEYVERSFEETLPAAEISRAEGVIRVSVAAADGDTASALLEERFPNMEVSRAEDAGKETFSLSFSPLERDALRDLTVDQALETIRNRIDYLGVTEPIIQREGREGILIQLPGIQDPERAKDLIGRTAVLELKLLPDNADAPERYESGEATLPDDWEILEGVEVKVNQTTRMLERTPIKYVVEKKTMLTGDTITNAQPRPGQTALDTPFVEFELNSEGASRFEELTGANVNRRMAIVLDNTVYSAPVIRDRIPGGRAIIQGDFELQEARDLAIVLRAGALPAPVTIAEERTVGPSLGQDSIDAGVLSFAVGGTLVLLFMLVYYRKAGALADAAVVLNVMLLLATLALFEATLTLPGIAGIVLTVGMAVDANVLINERIREELRVGKTARAAIEAGYERALPAILDSNITTFLAGVILFQFGSGPVKGFAVTLCIGIISTVFTAVLGTRTVYDYLLSTRRVQTVSI
jgi:preprotein translocase subunit SecD